MITRLIKIACSIILILLVTEGFAQVRELYELNRKKSFPQLEKLLSEKRSAISKKTKRVFTASILNAYGKTRESNKLLNKIDLDTAALSPTDTLAYIALKTRADNYVKTFDFKRAFLTARTLLVNYKNFYSEDLFEEEKEALKIWELLSDAPSQQLEKFGDSQISLKRDRAGLLNIPVTSAKGTYDFVFDSGAGMSVIAESYSKELNIKILSDSTVSIQSGITGIPTLAKLGLAEKISVGNMSIYNTVFLVFPDSTLSFANGAYKINGIIGFPVIKEFGEITFTDRTSLYVPRSSKNRNIRPNMILDELKPAIYLSYNNTLLPFTFDTGGSATILSDNFYRLFKENVEASGSEKVKELGGTGGRLKFIGFEVPELTLMSENIPLKLKNVFVSKEMISTNGEIYYGNIGQDVIKQFKRMTINFRDSFILFEDPQ